MKKTKIIATIGPASESVEVLKEMIDAGMNVARFNFSHGEHEWHARVMENVRSAAKSCDANIAILADLQGPRIRTIVDAEVTLQKGERIFVAEEGCDRREFPSRSKIVFLDCPGIVENLESGVDILIEDGLMRLRVEEKFKYYVTADVLDGGIVKNHKGVNIPNAAIPLPTLTEKDEKDLAFALTQDVGFIALSFVRTVDDVEYLRSLIEKKIPEKLQQPKIIIKVERKEAIEHFHDIMLAADAVMVARGDLGIEMEPHKVTLFQKELIIKSLHHSRPVIVATQMLDSMIENARPTRAEISDVTNAVIDHADATMLSGETTVGKHPVVAVRSMAEIATYTEESAFDDVTSAIDLHNASEHADAMRSAYTLAAELDAKAIIVFSQSGLSARLLSHFRPTCRLLAATNHHKTYSQLALAWGVEAFLFDGELRRSVCVEDTIALAKEKHILSVGDTIIVVLGDGGGSKAPCCVGSRVVE